MALNYHLLFKVLLVGDPEVGKATMLHQSGSESASCPSTVGVNFLKRKLELGKSVVFICGVYSSTQFTKLPRLFPSVHILPQPFNASTTIFISLVFQTVGKT